MHVLETILELLAPHDCVSCGREGSLLCNSCTNGLKDFELRCYRCLKATNRTRVCSDCQKLASLHDVFVATEYKRSAAGLIHKLKFERARAGAKVIAQLMDALLPTLPAGVIVTHIPTANSRIRERGYDQAALIAKNFAHLRKVPYSPLLRRVQQTRQVGATRAQRQAQLDGAFSIRKVLAGGRPILLVDDVITTGATIENAALTLKDGGVDALYAAAFAQKT